MTMSAPPQSAIDREANQALLAELRRSCDRFLKVLKDVPENREKIRATEGTWSILDCAEHVCLGEELMFAALKKRRPTDAPPDMKKDAVIHKIALDRSRKAASPEQAKPIGRYASLSEVVEVFRSSRQRTIDYVDGLNENLRSSTCVHPFGVFDSYQLVEIMALHSERHALQIEGIKNSIAYKAASQQQAMH